LARGSLTAITNAFVRDQGVTGLTLNPATRARSHVQRWLGALTAAIPCTPSDPDRCRVELTSAAILAHRDIEDPLGELSLSSRRVASRGARVSEQARLRYRLSDRLALTGSAAQEFETLDLALDGGERRRSRRAVSRGAASATFALTRALDLNALAAIEYHGTRGANPTDTVQPSGRVGARLRLHESFSISANVGRYARVPTLGELHGISPIVLGNALLAPERSTSFDLGAKLSTALGSSSLYAELFGFARLASDLIAYRQSQLGVVRPYNTKGARILGVELAAGAQLFHHLRAELSLTVLDPRDTSGELGQESLLPYQARVVAAPSLEVFQGPIAALGLDRASLAARLHHRSPLRVDPAGVIPVIPAQTTLDLELGLLFLRRRLGAQLRLANLNDSRNADVLGLPLPGRSVHGSMEVTW
ncbi:MAG: TonB-dependent receptor, partial [Minicystis sp.]